MTEGADRAAGFARVADLAAMKDQHVRKIDPFVLGREDHQVALDLFGCGFRGQPQATREALDMGVNDNPVGNAVNDT